MEFLTLIKLFKHKFVKSANWWTSAIQIIKVNKGWLVQQNARYHIWFGDAVVHLCLIVLRDLIVYHFAIIELSQPLLIGMGDVLSFLIHTHTYIEYREYTFIRITTEINKKKPRVFYINIFKRYTNSQEYIQILIWK